MRATGNAMRLARAQRRAMSPPEARLWALLRRAQGGVKFRRQHPIGAYVADFYCPAAKLVIEIDGKVHDNEDASVSDARRDEYMLTLGLRTVRIAAADVLRDPAEVADMLIRLCGPSTALRAVPLPIGFADGEAVDAGATPG